MYQDVGDDEYDDEYDDEDYGVEDPQGVLFGQDVERELDYGQHQR